MMFCDSCNQEIPRDEEWYVSSETNGLCIPCSCLDLINYIEDITEKAELWGIYTAGFGWDGQTKYQCACGGLFQVTELTKHFPKPDGQSHFILEVIK